jgi:hypothetical protein
MVDPQKIPDAYVKATVTGDVRNRLGKVVSTDLERHASAANHIIDTLTFIQQKGKRLPEKK